MTDYVTDTNVGKMTEQGAIEIIQAEFYVDGHGVPLDIEINTAFKMAIEALQFQQEFVTCKDCKHWDLSESYGFARMCEHWQDTMREYGYCSYGKRRDE